MGAIATSRNPFQCCRNHTGSQRFSVLPKPTVSRQTIKTRGCRFLRDAKRSDAFTQCVRDASCNEMVRGYAAYVASTLLVPGVIDSIIVSAPTLR